MSVLAAAVIVVGALCLVDLMLTFGVIRRLRSHTEMLSAPQIPATLMTGLHESDKVGKFSGTSADGEQLSGPAGLRMAAFFSSSCSTCPAHVPTFIDYVRQNNVGRDAILAVVVGSAERPPAYQDRLAQVATVVPEPDAAVISQAFKVTAYPTFYLLDGDGIVTAAGHDPLDMPAPAALQPASRAR